MTEALDGTHTAELVGLREKYPVGSGDLLGGRFVVEVLIGEGMFAWIYSALDLKDEPPHRVALKMYRSSVTDTRHELDCLMRVHSGEERIPNVVRPIVFEVLRHGDIPYIVIEFLEGISLRSRLLQHPPLYVWQTQAIAVGLARGLTALHAVGVVHCDVKPGNIFLRPDGPPVLIDLGIAQCVGQSTNRGLDDVRRFMTPRYASPEQLTGEDVGPGTDVYSLGVVLYEVCTGEPDPTPRQKRRVPRELREWLARCVEVDPAKRPTALGLAKGLCSAKVEMHRPSHWMASKYLLALSVLVWIGLPGDWAMRAEADTPMIPLYNSGVDYHSGLPRTTCPEIDPASAAIKNEWQFGWTHRLESTLTGRFCGSGADANGTVWFGGNFLGTVKSKGRDINARSGDKILLVKLNADGDVEWAGRPFEVMTQCHEIVVDVDGNVFIAGSTISGHDALVIIKVKSTGTVVWYKALVGDARLAPIKGMATDQEGNVVVYGEFGGTLAIDGVEIESAGEREHFLLKLGPNGNLLWHDHFGGAGYALPHGVSSNSKGDIVIAGSSSRNEMFDSSELTFGSTLLIPQAEGTYLELFDTVGRKKFAVHLGRNSRVSLLRPPSLTDAWFMISANGSKSSKTAEWLNPSDESLPSSRAWRFGVDPVEEVCMPFTAALGVAQGTSSDFLLTYGKPKSGEAVPSSSPKQGNDVPLYLARIDKQGRLLSSTPLPGMAEMGVRDWHVSNSTVTVVWTLQGEGIVGAFNGAGSEPLHPDFFITQYRHSKGTL